LTYLRTRYYDPDLGRFLARDMWPGIPTVPQTQNRYSYATNNPITYADPSGRFIDTALDIAFIVYDVASIIFGPEKDREGNLLALGADVASAFIPFVTGGGIVVRAGREAVEHADEVIGPIKWAQNVAAAACSFTPETLVATPDGPVPISTIEVGDVVLAWDDEKNGFVERPVTAVLPHQDDGIAVLTIDNDLVITTPDHPFYTIDRGWIAAGDLRPGDHLMGTRGVGTVEDLEFAPYRGLLWDLTVAEAHTFAVGAGGWIVHNADCGKVARDLQSRLGGGDIVTFTKPPGTNALGPAPGNPAGNWDYHTVLVKDGKVYDEFTKDGMPIAEWKAQWEYADEISFGF
jgi:hypothetical protein